MAARMAVPRSKETEDSKLSKLQKPLQKREIDRIHERNYNSGQVNFQENNLHRIGIKGRKIYVLLIVLSFLLMLCLFNLIVLIVVYSVLHINTSGMKSLSFNDNGDLKWLQDSYLESVLTRDGTIGGFNDQDMTFTGNSQNVTISGGLATRSASLTVGMHGTTMEVRGSLDFIDPFENKNILHISKNSNLKFGSNVFGSKLKSNRIQLPRIVSDENDLTITGSILNITGNEGIYLDGKIIKITSQLDVNITVRDSKSVLKLSGSTGIYLDSVASSGDGTLVGSSAVKRYRLCGCSNNGRLFKLEVINGTPRSCSVASKDPCI